jgi:hypothetical protein
MRFIVWLCIHSVYRIRHQDLSHIPEQGPGLLVCREAGARSVFIIAAACRRPVRFLVPERWWRIPILGFVLRAGPAIVLGAAGEGDPSPAILRALEAGDLCAGGWGSPRGPRCERSRTARRSFRSRSGGRRLNRCLAKALAAPRALRITGHSRGGPFDRRRSGEERRAVRWRISGQCSACSFPLSAIGSALVSAGRFTFDRLHMPKQPPQGEVVGDLHASGEHQRPAEG